MEAREETGEREVRSEARAGRRNSRVSQKDEKEQEGMGMEVGEGAGDVGKQVGPKMRG